MRFSYHPTMCDPSFYLELVKQPKLLALMLLLFQIVSVIQKNVIQHIHIMMMEAESFWMEFHF